MGAPQLQGAIGNAKAACRPLEAPVFRIGRILNGSFLGGTADVLEPGTEDNGALDWLPKLGVQPNHLVRF